LPKAKFVFLSQAKIAVEPNKTVHERIARLLAPHSPYGLLAYLDLSLTFALILSGLVSPLIAIGFGLAIYFMFGMFKHYARKDLVRLKELEIEQKRQAIVELSLQIGRDIYLTNPARVFSKQTSAGHRPDGRPTGDRREEDENA
jgi:hypothetical protein